jgi:hypothetical protein
MPKINFEEFKRLGLIVREGTFVIGKLKSALEEMKEKNKQKYKNRSQRWQKQSKK